MEKAPAVARAITRKKKGPQGPNSRGKSTTMDVTAQDRTQEALEGARRLVRCGVPVFAARPAPDQPTGYYLPPGWQNAVPDETVLDRWEPGMGLAAVTGHELSVIDIDVQNGGSLEAVEHCLPDVYGRVRTKSGGLHLFVAPLEMRSVAGALPGVDVRSGTSDGKSRGFVWLPGTRGRSKTGQGTGEYTWLEMVDPQEVLSQAPFDESTARFRAAVSQHRQEALEARQAASAAPEAPRRVWGTVEPARPSWGPGEPGTRYATAALADEVAAVRGAVEGTRNETLNRAAFNLGQLVGGQVLDEDAARWALLEAALAAGLDPREVETTVDSGMRAGKDDPRAPQALPAGVAVVTTRTRPQSPQGAVQTPPAGQERHAVGAVGDGLGGEPGGEPEEAEEAVRADDGGWCDEDLTDTVAAVLDGTLEARTPEVGVTADGTGLFYRGCTNGVAGESGAGKTWLALTVGIEEMKAGHDFWFLDLEDTKETAALRLVQGLGCPPELLSGPGRRFHYVSPRQWLQDAVWALLDAMTASTKPYVVLDSTGEGLAMAGCSPNADEEVTRWFHLLATPAAQEAGATVVLLDHMVKDSDNGGLWPIGSQRKRAAITGAQYVLEVVEPFSKDREGCIAMKVAKDRHGAREQHSVASFVQFFHPIEINQEEGREGFAGTIEMLSGRLQVRLGKGKDLAAAAADKAARQEQQDLADVAEIAALDPPPTSYRDVKKRLRWRDERAQRAMAGWRQQDAESR